MTIIHEAYNQLQTAHQMGGLAHPEAYVAGAIPPLYVAGAYLRSLRSEKPVTAAIPADRHAADQALELSDRTRNRRPWADITIGSLIAGAAILQMGVPQTTEISLRNNAKVAVVVDAGTDSIAADVLTENGALIPRVEGVFNAVQRISRQNATDVDMEIVFAGSRPEKVGTIINGEGAAEVASNGEAYLADIANTGAPDIQGGLRIADAFSPDMTVVFTSDGSGATERAIIDSKAAKEDALTIIAVGQPNTEYQDYTGTAVADYTTVFGDEAALMVQNEQDLTSALETLIDDEIERNIAAGNVESKTTTGLLPSLAATLLASVWLPLRVRLRNSNMDRKLRRN